jgi:hypothetical protein
MSEFKCLVSALVYFLAQLVVLVVKPVVHVLDLAAKKCGAVASQELAKISKKPEE